jgi:ERCC4-type nuclease
MELVIDNRERGLIKLLEGLNVEHQVGVLDIGDVNWVDSSTKEVFMVIERKTVADLKASICDGRSREQKARILNCGLSRDRIMFLIEGSLSKSLDSKIANIPVSTLIGSIVNMQLRDNIKVYRTMSLAETANYITRMDQKIRFERDVYFKGGGDAASPASYAATLKTRKRENMTPRVWYVSQLSLVPQVTERIATSVIEEYPTVIALSLAYEKLEVVERPKMLSDLTYPIANGKTRRIGDKISSRICELLYGI